MHHLTKAIVFTLISACSSDRSAQTSGDASLDDGSAGSSSGGAGGSGGSTSTATGGKSGGGTGGGSTGGRRDSGVERDAAPDATNVLDASAEAGPRSDASVRDAAALDATTDARPTTQNCTSVTVGTTFSSIYANLLSVQCVPCHTQRFQGTGTRPLEFPPGQAFDVGVDVAYADLLDGADGGKDGAEAKGYACGPTGLRKVVPGDPDHSLLVEKLEGTNGTDQAVCGARMPFQKPPICQPVIDGIRKWIANGALKN